MARNIIISYNTIFCRFGLGDKFNGNIIFDICQRELLQVNVRHGHLGKRECNKSERHTYMTPRAYINIL